MFLVSRLSVITVQLIANLTVILNPLIYVVTNNSLRNSARDHARQISLRIRRSTQSTIDLAPKLRRKLLNSPRSLSLLGLDSRHTYDLRAQARNRATDSSSPMKAYCLCCFTFTALVHYIGQIRLQLAICQISKRSVRKL